MNRTKPSIEPPRLLLAGLLSLIVTGCSGPPDDEVTEASEWPRPHDAWVSDVTRNPTLFTDLMERTDRDGWVALHANDLPAAVEAFSGTEHATLLARARAEWALAVFYDDLSRFSGVTHERFFTEWRDRGSMPAQSSAHHISALGARCYGGDAATWGSYDVPGAWDTVIAQMNEGGEPDAEDPWVHRRQLHQGARQGELAQLVAVADQPLVVEPEEGFDRTFYDPCLYRTLSDTWMDKASQSLGGTDWHAAQAWGAEDAGLEGMLFAAWLTREDLDYELKFASHPGEVGSHPPSLAALGVSMSRLRSGEGSDDDQQDVSELQAARQQAKEEVRALDGSLERWKRTLSRKADSDGKALLLELGMAERFRQELLVTRARVALRQGQAETAVAILELARDVAEPSVGPTNSPSMLALLAEGQLRLGHTREALDILQVLTQTHPEVIGLKELAGDLAVLQGLDRQGDSKEN